MRKCIFKLVFMGIILTVFTSCTSNDDKILYNYSSELELVEKVTAVEKSAVETVKGEITTFSEQRCSEITENTDCFVQDVKSITELKNTVVRQPIMNEVTFQISEKLVGKYEMENCPDLYFEIKPNGELGITVMTFDGIAEYKNSNELILTAFYQGDEQTTISFSLIGGTNTFPEGYLSLDFIGDGDCICFRRNDEYYKDERYIKVD